MRYRPPLARQKQKKRKIKTDDYQMKPCDFELRQSLNDWRRKQLEAEFGSDDFFGPQRILSDQIRDRIVDLAHCNKITSTQVLQEQTDWSHATKYSTAIFDIIQQYALPPASPFVSTPLRTNILQGLGEAHNSPTPQRQNTTAKSCGACHQSGHTGKL